MTLALLFVLGLAEPAPLDKALWFALVKDGDRVVASENAAKLAIPASNRKLFSSLLIAECGLYTTIPTEFWLDGEDLVVKGFGDPSLGATRWERAGDFDRVAELLAKSGVASVRDIIADVSQFDRELLPGNWKLGNVGRDVAAPVDAIAWRENEIPVDRAIENPGLNAAEALRDALVLRDIAVRGELRVNTEPRAWSRKVATLESPFVADLLTTVLQNSHNLYAEMLFKRAGHGTYARALADEEALLARIGIDPEDVRFVDASGLAPDDLATAEAMVTALQWMAAPERRGVWWQLLAQPGGNGSLRRRLLPFAETLRGKTGSTNGVNTLTGIVAMPGGGYRAFAIAVNHHATDGGAAVALIDELVATRVNVTP